MVVIAQAQSLVSDELVQPGDIRTLSSIRTAVHELSAAALIGRLVLLLIGAGVAHLLAIPASAIW